MDSENRLRKALEAIRIEAERENGRWQHLKRVIAIQARQALASPADELEATIKTDRVANVRYYYSMETFAVTLRDGRQGQGSTIRAAIDNANQRKAT